MKFRNRHTAYWGRGVMNLDTLSTGWSRKAYIHDLIKTAVVYNVVHAMLLNSAPTRYSTDLMLSIDSTPYFTFCQ